MMEEFIDNIPNERKQDKLLDVMTWDWKRNSFGSEMQNIRG
jgi:hypothetical protein